MKSKDCFARRFGSLFALSSLAILIAGNKALAQNTLSDRMLITDPTGLPIFDNVIFEGAAAPIEPPLTFAGPPFPVPPPIPPIAAIGIPGVSIVVLAEPPGPPSQARHR